eukprot:CAMPEP_0180336776 /NCGR_PEP_ID=MMETSP0988-20121125/44986_1 /TAXON_ID=697907 /ORGANISM="non described non described, Strain CCMP2293" /LENGTH=153 /DNA_ID=CAMNT_0022324991 /DNA_START=27 /DNA_END=485 /DNA_ORIENTATION=-
MRVPWQVAALLIALPGAVAGSLSCAPGRPPVLELGAETRCTQRAGRNAALRLRGGFSSDARAIVGRAPVVVAMEGSEEAPQTPDGRRVVEILRRAGIAFESFDVSGDASAREELKREFKWDRFPQVYAHGSLVGDASILESLEEEGVLQEELA